MHIPDGFLATPVWAGMDVVSGALVTVGLQRASKQLEERAIPLIGVLAAFVFAAQMINLPIAGGTSAHLLGGALVGILLGPWTGLVLMTLVLLVQCFLFQDGGVAALGCNIFNMGVVGSMGSTLVYRALRPRLNGPRSLFWAAAIAGWIGIVGSSACCATMLVASQVVSPHIGYGVIVGVHAVLGLLEAVVTGTALQSIYRVRPDLFLSAKG